MDKFPDNYYCKSRNSILDLLGSIIPEKTLDVGCGAGQFSMLLKKRFNCETWGLDPVHEISMHDTNTLDKSFFGSFSDHFSSLPCSFFDVIFFNDVLEHMEDPWSCLRDAQTLLMPEGFVVASIPNFLWVDNIYQLMATKDWRYEQSGILDKTHLRFFTKKSIIRLFKEAGYDILSLRPLACVSSWKWLILKACALGALDDFVVYQYGVVAKPSVSQSFESRYNNEYL